MLDQELASYSDRNEPITSTQVPLPEDNDLDRATQLVMQSETLPMAVLMVKQKAKEEGTAEEADSSDD